MAKGTCSVEDCSRPMHGHGFCSMHLQRWKRRGDALAPTRLWRASAADRLLSHCETNPSTGCWEWTAALQKDGYGTFGDAGISYLAHRRAYEVWRGPIPDDREIDHLCRVRHCINPDHLEVVTHAENVRRAIRVPKTHCKNGHEYTPETSRYRRVGKYIVRYCHICTREKGREADRRRYARSGNARGQGPRW